MRLFTGKGVLAAFYFLMAADGDISQIEIEKLDQIRKELELEDFTDYLEVLSENYEIITSAAFEDDDPCDLIQEGIDAALKEEPKEGEKGISPRLLVWNLLVMACSDGVYHAQERRIIKHIVRTTGVEKSVFLEMEQLIQTAVAVEKEIAWLSSSQKPYAEIQPIVAELETRQNVILTEAKALLKDERESRIETLKYQPDFIDTAKKKVEETVAPVVDSIGKAVTPVVDKIGDQAGKLFSGIFGSKKKKSDPADVILEQVAEAEKGAEE